MKRCKVGDVVLVVMGKQVGLIGRIVEVSDLPGCDWSVEFPRLVRTAGRFGSVELRRRGEAPDCWLRPIRPDADPVETETEREVVA